MFRTASKTVILVLAVGSLLTISRAAIIEKDSSNFAWKYEMGAKPSDEDLDGNLTDDFTEWPGSSSRASVSGGILTINGTTGQTDYTSTIAGELWPAQGFSLAEGYTIETRMKVISQAAGASAAAIVTANPGVANANGYLQVRATGQAWDTGTGISLGGDDNTDGFHTFRIAQEPGSSANFTVWRDNVQIGSGLGSTFPNTLNRIRFGDDGGSSGGNVEVDYFRFTPGTYAPVSGLRDFDDAAAWYRFGDGFQDSNGPPNSDGTGAGGIAEVADSSATGNMSNGTIAQFGSPNSSKYVDLNVDENSELRIDGNQGLTVFARIRPADNASSLILSRDDYYNGGNAKRAFALDNGSGGGLMFRVFDGADEFRASAARPADYAGEWHDMVGVFRSDESVELWLDGVLLDTLTTGIPTTINDPLIGATTDPVPIYIGRRHGNLNTMFRGDMESVAIWDYSLTADEIRGLSVPEPASITLLALGLLAMMFFRRR